MLFKLLFAPIALPVSGLKFVLEQVAELAERELYDESSVHDQLLLLQVQLEEGDIDEAEYAQQEAELMQRLRDIKALKQAERDEEVAELPIEADVSVRRRLVVVETPFDDSEP